MKNDYFKILPLVLTVFFWLLAMLPWYGMSGDKSWCRILLQKLLPGATRQTLECLLGKTYASAEDKCRQDAGRMLSDSLTNPCEAGTFQYSHDTQG